MRKDNPSPSYIERGEGGPMNGAYNKGDGGMVVGSLTADDATDATTITKQSRGRPMDLLYPVKISYLRLI
jgi:hypothetical protein